MKNAETKEKAKEKEKKLWAVYQADHSIENRNSLVLFYQQIVREIANQITVRKKVELHAPFNFDDLVNEGNIGLINAIDSFNPLLGFDFLSFAWSRIRGEMIDAIRERVSDEDFVIFSCMSKEDGNHFQFADHRDNTSEFESLDSFNDTLNQLCADQSCELTERERQIVVLYYHEGLTFEQIGKQLELSTSWVHETHAKILTSLRARLTAAA